MQVQLGDGFDSQVALNDPRVREAVVKELMARTPGVFDSHPDPDVGRILLPNLKNAQLSGQPLSSNKYGMRERPYELPKPENVCRVVLLGDSYVFGLGERAENRAGVFLEQYLKDKAGNGKFEIEVLHLGLGSWGAVTEAAFVRRQLSDLQPDLVLNLLIPNDLDDTNGIRGFGGRSTFSDRDRSKTDSIVFVGYTRSISGEAHASHLLLGHGWESAYRYQEMVDHVVRLAEATERIGSRFVMVGHWASFNPRLHRAFKDRLREDQVQYLPMEFENDMDLRLSESDPHWNRAGNERVAQLFFGMIRERDLLPQLELQEWPEVEEQARDMMRRGTRMATKEPPASFWKPHHTYSAILDFTGPDGPDGKIYRQIAAGVDAQGRAGSYVSMLLPNTPGAKFRFQGRAFDRPEIDGAQVEVFVEEHSLGFFEIQASQDLAFEAQVPAELADLDYVTVRFISDDYFFTGEYLRHCVAFQLKSVSLMP